MAPKQPILQMIRDADRTRLLPDMQNAVSEIVEAIELARGAGKGKITLELTISSPSEGAYEIEPKLTVKVPKPPRAKMMTFFNEETGELERRDPRQPELPEVIAADFRNKVQPAGQD